MLNPLPETTAAVRTASRGVWSALRENVSARLIRMACRVHPQFRPGVFYTEELRLTEIILKDAMTIWRPWGPYKGHAVDCGYDENGDLIGIKIWDDVRKEPPNQ